MEAGSPGCALEACGRDGLDAWSSGRPVVRATTWRYGGLEFWTSGHREARCRCVDGEGWRHGGLETRCRCSDGEGWTHGGMEFWRLDVSVVPWKDRPTELW